MSAHKQSGQDRELPLPSPRSPAQLDEKVLAYARTHTPRKRFPIQPAWAAGLATTGVIVLALFITLPQQPAPSITREPSTPVMMASPAADADAGAEHKRATAKTAAEEKPAARAARKDMPTAQMIHARELEQEVREQRAMSDQAFAEAAPGAEPTLQQQLQSYASLLQQGKETEARAAYQALRASCSDCQLPATLEQALAAYPPPEQP